MTDDDMEIVARSGNVFRDFGYPDADVRQGVWRRKSQGARCEKLSPGKPRPEPGVAHSEFVRIRNVNIARFTIDRLVTILGRLG